MPRPNTPAPISPGGAAARAPLPGLIQSGKAFLVLLACWFLAQVSLRVLTSTTANLDEAEQLMLTQSWAWGYGPQPPLYTWLQAALFDVAGVSIASLALLKNALLFCTYCLAFLIGRQITGKHSTGVVSALSLFLIPQFAWESQRDLTHSVLASTLALATLFCVLKCRERSSLKWHLLLGATLGLGGLAKYNFLLWAAGLLLATFSIPAFRRRVWNWHMAGTLALAIVIVAPHANWALKNRDKVAQTASKLEIASASQATSAPGTGSPFIHARVSGMWNLLSAVGRFSVALLAIHALFIWRSTRACGFVAQPTPPEATLILRAFMFVILMILFGIFTFGASGIKDRWLQPILVSLPVFMAVRFWPVWETGVARWLWRLCALVMMVVAISIPGKVIFAGQLGRGDRLNLPIPQLGALLAQRIEPDTTLLADSNFLAGNLRLGMPRHRILSKHWGEPGAAPVCIVWDARERRNPPPELLNRAGDHFTGNERMFLDGTVRHEPGKTYRLGVAW